MSETLVVRGHPAVPYKAPAVVDKSEVEVVGTVKWYCDKKGYGFVPHRGEDVFFHATQLKRIGVRVVHAGQMICLCAIRTAKGMRASRVKRVFERGT